MKGKEIIKAYYEAFNQKNYSSMLSLLAEDCVHDINQGKRMKGREEFKKFLERMDFLYDETLTDFIIMENGQGTRAAAEFICKGTYKNTDEGLPSARGQKYEIPVGAFFELENDKIKRVTNYYNLNDWIEMVK